MAAITLTLLYEDEVFRIGYNKVFSLLEFSFLTHPDSTRFRNGYSLALDVAFNKDIKYWLTDATQIKAMERENQVWLMEKMAPWLKSCQTCRFAIVMAPECFVMTNPNQVYEKPKAGQENQRPGQIKVHFGKEAAYNWLFSGQEITIV